MAVSRPPPRAFPLMAAITGLGPVSKRFRKRDESKANAKIGSLSLVAYNWVMSAPAMKLSGFPLRMTTALTEARAALADTRKLVNRVDDRIDPLLTTTQQAFQQAIATLREAETTLAAAHDVVEPDSTIMIQVRDSLREINTAATAIRVLADYLQRNPNALLTGK